MDMYGSGCVSSCVLNFWQ